MFFFPLPSESNLGAEAAEPLLTENRQMMGEDGLAKGENRQMMGEKRPPHINHWTWDGEILG